MQEKKWQQQKEKSFEWKEYYKQKRERERERERKIDVEKWEESCKKKLGNKFLAKWELVTEIENRRDGKNVATLSLSLQQQKIFVEDKKKKYISVARNSFDILSYYKTEAEKCLILQLVKPDNILLSIYSRHWMDGNLICSLAWPIDEWELPSFLRRQFHIQNYFESFETRVCRYKLFYLLLIFKG